MYTGGCLCGEVRFEISGRIRNNCLLPLFAMPQGTGWRIGDERCCESSGFQIRFGQIHTEWL